MKVELLTPLWKAVKLPSDEPVQYVGTYVLKWGKVSQPDMGFISVDDMTLEDALRGKCVEMYLAQHHPDILEKALLAEMEAAR